jgi:glycosyltransferase involved in cell wall biosynthesis
MVRKKILLSSNILWTITQFRLGLIKTLVSTGYEVVCVADLDEFSSLSSQKLQESGARFVCLKMNRKSTDPLHDLQYLFRYYHILKREKPDLVINYTIKPVIYGSLAAQLMGIPSFAVTTGLGFVFIHDNLLTRITRLLYKFSLKFPGKVFFLNKDDKEAFLTHHLVSHVKACLLPGEGIDTEYYHPLPGSNSPEDFTFLMIGRLLKEKGAYEFSEAAALIKSEFDIAVHFRFTGYLDEDNPGAVSKSELELWVSNGWLKYDGPCEDIRPVIAKSDCIVLPSYREGVPRTLLEAASMEKPIIATNVPGCREVVTDGLNGFLCEPKSSQDLYDKMVRMINLTEDERERMGQAGREKIIQQFDEKIITDIYLEEIRKVIRSSK